MAKHNETGAKGELLALEHLRGKGYKILATNWRSGHKEIDILAADGPTLLIIEIKTRGGLAYGYPEEAVTKPKQEMLRKAADKYMEAHREYTQVRYDVISIMMKDGVVTELLHLEDAFY